MPARLSEMLSDIGFGILGYLPRLPLVGLKERIMRVEVTTKFDIGDEVFFRSHGEICSGIVSHVQITYVKTEKDLVCLNAVYRLKNSRGERYLEDFWEKRLHATKEELLIKNNE